MKQINIKGKRVFLRADLNIPLQDKKIIDAYRLNAILPTIDFLKNHGAKIILGTHIGRPQKTDPNLSTIILVNWFTTHGYKITFENNLEKAYEKSFEHSDEILLLENLRFFPGEKSGSIDFAKKLARLADYYVNDAFAVCHERDTSVTLLAQQFPEKKRFLGPLVKKELTALAKLLKHPKRPFVLIIGGGKITEKIPLIEHLLDIVDTILLCPATVFTFLKAIGKSVGNSLIDDSLIPIISRILKKAKEKNVTILFPRDYVIAKEIFDGPISFVASPEIPDHMVGISIGEKTEKYFEQEIQKAHTIFFNGAFGNIHKQETMSGLKHIFEAMAKSDAYTVIGGGDSVASAYAFGLAEKIDYLSTAGGATLAYLSGAQLPGLQAFHITQQLKNWTES